jgi:PKD repeat protein
MSKTVQFTDTSTNANTYYWQFGDGNTSGDRNPIHTYEEYGDYVVILTITDNNGNSDEFQQNVSLSLPNVDEPPVDETTEDTEDTIIEEVTDEETSYEDDTEETTTETTEETTTEQQTYSEPMPSSQPVGFNPQMGRLQVGTLSPEGQWIWNGSAWNPNDNYVPPETTTTTTTTTESDDSDTGDTDNNNDGGGYGDDDTGGTPGGGRPGPDGP